MIGAGLELRARGRRAEQPHAGARGVERLVDVAPQQCAHVAVRIEDVEQRIAVIEPDRIEPATGDRDRVVMQADERMVLAMSGEQVMRGPPYPLRLTSSLVMPHAFTICTGWPRN